MSTYFAVALSNAIVATLLALLLRTVRDRIRPPALVHALWVLVLLKLVTPPLFTLPLGFGTTDPPLREPAAVSGPGTDAPSPSVAAVEAPEAISTPAPVPPEASAPSSRSQPREALPWKELLAGLWIGGSGTWILLVVLRLGRFRRMLQIARPAPERLLKETRTLASRLGLARIPSVSVVPGAISPMIFAFGGAARVLVPEAILSGVTEQGARSLLAHELAHLRRRDHWIRVLELLVTAVYWWLPVVWWVRRELRRAEEQCCDAWVVWALPDHEEDYAEALVQIVGVLSRSPASLPPIASGIGHFSELKRRITMVLQESTPHRLSAGARRAVIGLGLLLPLFPAWASPGPAPVPTEPPGSAREPQRDEASESIYLYEKAADQLKLDRELLKKAELEFPAPGILEHARAAVEKDTVALNVAHQTLVDLARRVPEVVKRAGVRPSCTVCHASTPEGQGRTTPALVPPVVPGPMKLDLPTPQNMTPSMAQPPDVLSAMDEKTGYRVSVVDEGKTLECLSPDGQTVWRTMLGSRGTTPRQLSIRAGKVQLREATRTRTFDLMTGKAETWMEAVPPSSVAQNPPLTGKVTAVAPGISLVVVSLGKDKGVREGQAFDVSRGNQFVARIVIDRTDRDWSAGKITYHSADPRVGDDVSSVLDPVAELLASRRSRGGPGAEKEAPRPLTGKIALLDRSRGLLAVDVRDSDGARAGMRFLVRRQGQKVDTIVLVEVQQWGSWAKPEGDLGIDRFAKDDGLEEIRQEQTPIVGSSIPVAPRSSGDLLWPPYGQKFEGQNLIDVLKARMEIQTARLRESELAAQQAARRLDRVRELARKGVASESELLDRQNEAELYQSQVEIKCAELKEVEVMLRQAEAALRKSEPTRPR